MGIALLSIYISRADAEKQYPICNYIQRFSDNCLANICKNSEVVARSQFKFLQFGTVPEYYTDAFVGELKKRATPADAEMVRVAEFAEFDVRISCSQIVIEKAAVDREGNRAAARVKFSFTQKQGTDIQNEINRQMQFPSHHPSQLVVITPRKFCSQFLQVNPLTITDEVGRRVSELFNPGLGGAKRSWMPIEVKGNPNQLAPSEMVAKIFVLAHGCPSPEMTQLQQKP